MIADQLLVRSAASARERKAVSDGALLLNALVTFAAVTAAWFYRLIEFNVGTLAWLFFGYTALQVLGSIVTDRVESRRGMMWWIGASNAAAVLFLAFAWAVAGGVKNPLFLLSLVVPVVVTGVLQTRWAYFLAILSSVFVTVSALAQTPELSWTAERVGLVIPFVSRSISAGAADPLPGVEVTPSSLMLMLVLFAVAQLLLARMARSVGGRTVALTERLVASAATRPFGGVTHASLIADPFPTLIVHSDSGQIHLASRSFLNQMLVREAELPGKTIFDVIEFDNERLVREALRNGGKLTLVYRVGPERRVADAAVHVFESDGEKFAAIRLDEATAPEPLAVDPEPTHEEELLPIEQERRRPVKMTWSFLIAAVLAFGGTSSAAAQNVDNWYVTFQYDHMSTDDAGGGASVEWHRRLANSRHLLAGAFAFTMSDSTWEYARLGYVTPAPGNMIATLGADLGAGDAAGRGFDYRILRGSLRRPIDGTRYALEGEAQHLLVDTVHGLMLKGALLGSFRRFDASVGVHTSASGNLDSQFVSGRIDVARPNGKIFGGFAAGRSQPDVRQLVVAPESSESFEMFLGFTATPQITIVLNTVEFEQVSRYSALVSWKTVR